MRRKRPHYWINLRKYEPHPDLLKLVGHHDVTVSFGLTRDCAERSAKVKAEGEKVKNLRWYGSDAGPLGGPSRPRRSIFFSTPKRGIALAAARRFKGLEFPVQVRVNRLELGKNGRLKHRLVSVL